MSAYITLATPITDQDCLLLALADLGYGSGVVEIHAEPVPLSGYEGGRRPQRAEIVIRRQHVGPASNDIGFERTPTGFRAHVSDYDRARHGDAWLARLRERYEAHTQDKLAWLAEDERRRREEERRQLVESQRRAIHDKARALGYRIEETREGDAIRMVLVKRVY